MADITVQDISIAGVTPSYGAAAAGDTIPVSGDDRVFLHVKNTSGSSINVTITEATTAATVPGYGSVTLSNRVVAVPASGEKMIGPFGAAEIDPATGKVSVSYSATASVTRAAFRLPKAA